jgi:protein-disulfide isomerase
MAPLRRLGIVLFALTAALGLRVAEAAAPIVGAALVSTEDMSMGNPKAKVTMIEYGSASCPHCAEFSNTTFKAFKTKYVDTGKVRYVFREMLTPPNEFAAAGFMAARCAGPAKYFTFLDALYAAQADIYKSGDTQAGLRKVAHDQGLSDEQLNACIFDQQALKALNTRLAKADDEGVNATPTFVIGKTRLVGLHTLAELSEAVDAGLAK